MFEIRSLYSVRSVFIIVTMSADCEEFNLEDNFPTLIDIPNGIKCHCIPNLLTN